MQRLGIFGGTFNPPHRGHLYIASQAMEKAKLDRVIFIPCGNPPHKAVDGDIDALHRLEMTRLAVEGESKFTVSDVEVCETKADALKKSYTSDTLERLARNYPDDRLCFVVGADSLRDMEKWHCPEVIFKLAEIVAVSRGGIDEETVAEKTDFYRRKYNASITVVKVLPVELSSSDIRKKIRLGECLSDVVPDAVLDYIEKNRIYKENV